MKTPPGRAGHGSFGNDTSARWIDAGCDVFRPQWRRRRTMLHDLVTPAGRRDLRMAFESHLLMAERHGGYSARYLAGCRRWLRLAGRWRRTSTRTSSDLWAGGPSDRTP